MNTDAKLVDHAVENVRENAHVNGWKSFGAWLKRGLSGTYISVEPFHLFRYVDEQAFRFNKRLDEHGDKLTDADHFELLVSQIVGKRLQYQELFVKADQSEARTS